MWYQDIKNPTNKSLETFQCEPIPHVEGMGLKWKQQIIIYLQ